MIAIDALLTTERHLREATEATGPAAAWRLLELGERLANALSDQAGPDDEPAYLLAAAHLNMARSQLEQGPLLPLPDAESLDLDLTHVADLVAVAGALARATNAAATALAVMAARSRSRPALVVACSQASIAAHRAADALGHESTP